MANIVDPDETPHILQLLIWVYTVCSGLSVRIYDTVNRYRPRWLSWMRQSHCCKQCGPRSDCSFRSSLIWVHTVCLYAKCKFEKFARRCSRRYKQTTSASVAQLDAPSDWRPGGRGFNPRRGRQHSFVEIDHEIFSTVILSLPLIQEGQLSVSGERMCTILVNRLED